ncbi:unnamed protein product [Amoebophrya sp. A120]|nr:unnamed protein product [Amoebophrya sp. A120]|eukprot:GSA120T00011649001.1
MSTMFVEQDHEQGSYAADGAVEENREQDDRGSGERRMFSTSDRPPSNALVLTSTSFDLTVSTPTDDIRQRGQHDFGNHTPSQNFHSPVADMIYSTPLQQRSSSLPQEITTAQVVVRRGPPPPEPLIAAEDHLFTTPPPRAVNRRSGSRSRRAGAQQKAASQSPRKLKFFDRLFGSTMKKPLESPPSARTMGKITFSLQRTAKSLFGVSTGVRRKDCLEVDSPERADQNSNGDNVRVRESRRPPGAGGSRRMSRRLSKQRRNATGSEVDNERRVGENEIITTDQQEEQQHCTTSCVATTVAGAKNKFDCNRPCVASSCSAELRLADIPAVTRANKGNKAVTSHNLSAQKEDQKIEGNSGVGALDATAHRPEENSFERTLSGLAATSSSCEEEDDLHHVENKNMLSAGAAEAYEDGKYDLDFYDDESEDFLSTTSDEEFRDEEVTKGPEMWQLPFYHLSEFLDLKDAIHLAMTCKEFYEQRRIAHLRLAPNLVTKDQFDQWMPIQNRQHVVSLCLTNLVMDVRPFHQLRHFKINLDMSKKLRKNILPEVTTDNLFKWLNLSLLEELCVDSLTTLPDLTHAYNLKHLFLAFRADNGRKQISFKCGSTKLRSVQLASCNLGHATSNDFPPLSASDICTMISQLDHPERLLHLRLRRIKLVDNVRELCDLISSSCRQIRMFTFTTQPLALSFQDMLRLRLGLGLVAFSARANGAATSDAWPNFWPTMKYFWPRGVNSITPFTVFSTDFAFDELGIVAEDEWARMSPTQLLRYCDITDEIKRAYAKSYPTRTSVILAKCSKMLKSITPNSAPSLVQTLSGLYGAGSASSTDLQGAGSISGGAAVLSQDGPTVLENSSSAVNSGGIFDTANPVSPARSPTVARRRLPVDGGGGVGAAQGHQAGVQQVDEQGGGLQLVGNNDIAGAQQLQATDQDEPGQARATRLSCIANWAGNVLPRRNRAATLDQGENVPRNAGPNIQSRSTTIEHEEVLTGLWTSGLSEDLYDNTGTSSAGFFHQLERTNSSFPPNGRGAACSPSHMLAVNQASGGSRSSGHDLDDVDENLNTRSCRQRGNSTSDNDAETDFTVEQRDSKDSMSSTTGGNQRPLSLPFPPVRLALSLNDFWQDEASSGDVLRDIYHGIHTRPRLPEESDSDIEFLRCIESRTLRDPQFIAARQQRAITDLNSDGTTTDGGIAAANEQVDDTTVVETGPVLAGGQEEDPAAHATEEPAASRTSGSQLIDLPATTSTQLLQESATAGTAPPPRKGGKLPCNWLQEDIRGSEVLISAASHPYLPKHDHGSGLQQVSSTPSSSSKKAALARAIAGTFSGSGQAVGAAGESSSTTDNAFFSSSSSSSSSTGANTDSGSRQLVQGSSRNNHHGTKVCDRLQRDGEIPQCESEVDGARSSSSSSTTTRPARDNVTRTTASHETTDNSNEVNERTGSKYSSVVSPHGGLLPGDSDPGSTGEQGESLMEQFFGAAGPFVGHNSQQQPAGGATSHSSQRPRTAGGSSTSSLAVTSNLSSSSENFWSSTRSGAGSKTNATSTPVNAGTTSSASLPRQQTGPSTSTSPARRKNRKLSQIQPMEQLETEETYTTPTGGSSLVVQPGRSPSIASSSNTPQGGGGALTLRNDGAPAGSSASARTLIFESGDEEEPSDFVSVTSRVDNDAR